MNNKNNIIGNGSTIVKTIVMVFAGWAIGYFASKGLNLPISEEELAELLFMLVCLAWAYIDAKYPNSLGFLHKAPAVEVENEEIVLNDEYEEELGYEE